MSCCHGTRAVSPVPVNTRADGHKRTNNVIGASRAKIHNDALAERIVRLTYARWRVNARMTMLKCGEEYNGRKSILHVYDRRYYSYRTQSKVWPTCIRIMNRITITLYIHERVQERFHIRSFSQKFFYFIL